MTPEREAMAQTIRKYLDLGLAIMPIRPRSKLPVGPWEQHAQERPTKAQWSAWWAQYPECNVALVYASSAAPEGQQLVCVDTDTPEAEAWVAQQVPLPVTPTARTAKGRHRYYYAPTGLEHSAASEHFPEVRAGVHYTLLPPSIHPDGPVYEWEFGQTFGEVAPAPLPEWGIALMGKPRAAGKPAPERPQAEGSSYGLEALRREAEAVASALAGTRNDRLNTAAFCLGQLIAGGQLAEADVAAALRSACERNGWIPEFGDRAFLATLRSGIESGKRQPRAPEPTRRSQAPAKAEAWVDEDGVIHDGAEEVAAAVNGVPAYTPPADMVRGARPLSEIAGDLIARLEERRSLPRKIYGPRTGWDTLDWWYLGFKWEGLIVISGSTGSGKTTVARHFMFASSQAIIREGSDERLLFYFCEGGRDQLLRRYASWQHGIPYKLLCPGSNDHMTPEWERRFEDTYSEFPNLPIDLCDSTSDAFEIMADIRRRAQEGPIAGIVIDNVQLLTYKGGSDYQNNKAAALEALALADALEVPIIVLSQVNREGNTWKDRGGPEWGNNATCKFYVRRGERGSPVEEENASNVTTLHNSKRRGEGGVCPALKLLGDQQTGRLYEEHDYDRIQEARSVREERKAWANN